MASNILAVLGGDHAAMAQQAREHALQFSWDRSMEELFGYLYPAALTKRARLRHEAPPAAALAA
jgi:alpha-1,6-mannosyltransferase